MLDEKTTVAIVIVSAATKLIMALRVEIVNFTSFLSRATRADQLCHLGGGWGGSYTTTTAKKSRHTVPKPFIHAYGTSLNTTP
jgi:hypothetical protein